MGDLTKLPDLSRTAAAFEQWKESLKAWRTEWIDQAHAETVIAETARLALAVGVAYCIDTADRNSLSHAAACAPCYWQAPEDTWIAKTLARWRAQ